MIDISNKKYNKLLVIEIDSSKTRGLGRQLYWKCLCECGLYTSVDSWSLRNNKIKSCGCLQVESRHKTQYKKHGQWQSRTYHSWEGMKQRCLNPNATRYPDYGAKGVLVCTSWLEFENFYKDMGDRPINKTLDRINPFGNYEKDNCRWATRKEQQNNQRRHHVVSEESRLC